MPINERLLPADGNARVRVKTGPTKEPVSVGEFKSFARIDGVADDAYILGLLTGVRGAVEQYIGKALIEQTLVLSMDFWPSDSIDLPRPPLISIEQVRTIDESDTATTYAASNYYVIRNDWRPKLVLRQGVQPPSNEDRDYQGYEVEYKAGFGSTASHVPDLIRQGIMQWAAVGYENRVLPSEPPAEAKALLDLHKVPRV